MPTPHRFFILARPLAAAARCLLAGAAASLFQPAYLAQGLPGEAQAQATSAYAQFTVKAVRPEAFSWFWDNVDEALLKAANSDNKSFSWTQPPATPQHLGYSAGAQHRSVATFGGATHTVDVTYLAPDTVRGRVASDNFLGAKPYSFVAQNVSVDGKPPFTVLIQYNPVGSTFADSLFTIQATMAADPALAQAYVAHVRKTLQGLQPTLMDALNTRYFNAVLKKRGYLKNIDESEEINACTVKVKVDVDGEDQDWLFLFKNETHNHPTEIEPFGGAATCVGGAIRDPLSGRSYVYQAMRVTGAGDRPDVLARHRLRRAAGPPGRRTRRRARCLRRRACVRSDR